VIKKPVAAIKLFKSQPNEKYQELIEIDGSEKTMSRKATAGNARSPQKKA
jgi:hypothetical protein